MSETNPLPSIRPEIRAEVYKEDGREYVYLLDPQNYATQPVSIPTDFLPLMSYLNGNYSLQEVEKDLAKNYPKAEAKEVVESFVNLVNFLDYMGYLKSKRFLWMKEDIDNYLQQKVRPPYCAGSSYAAETSELANQMKELFSSVSPDEVKANAKMIIVPHIDFRIGANAHKAYAMGYYALREERPDLVVIFGTSHNGSTKRFILSEKDFETPFGVVENARDISEKLMSVMDDEDEVIFDEICHRNEHSIEFQVLLSQYFFNTKFKILPILVNSFVGDIYKQRLPDEDVKFRRFLEVLNKAIAQSHYNPVYIASVDLAHIGRKFDDDFDAKNKLEILRQEDEELIHHLAHCNADSFFRSVAEVKDRNKICGLAPIYSILKMLKPVESRFLYYDVWYEEETKSAVSFASFAFYD